MIERTTLDLPSLIMDLGDLARAYMNQMAVGERPRNESAIADMTRAMALMATAWASLDARRRREDKEGA